MRLAGTSSWSWAYGKQYKLVLPACTCETVRQWSMSSYNSVCLSLPLQLSIAAKKSLCPVRDTCLHNNRPKCTALAASLAVPIEAAGWCAFGSMHSFGRFHLWRYNLSQQLPIVSGIVWIYHPLAQFFALPQPSTLGGRNFEAHAREGLGVKKEGASSNRMITISRVL